MKNNMLQNLETIRKKELPPVRPADSPVKIPVHDPYGTDDPDTLDVRAGFPPAPIPTKFWNLMLRFIIILQISFTDHDKPYGLIISFFQKFPQIRKRCLFSALLQHDEDLFQLCPCLSMHGTVQIRAFALIILPR